MKLGAVAQPVGAHIAAWREPASTVTTGTVFEAYRALVAEAERGKFQFAFVADTLGVRDWPLSAVARSPHASFLFEPITLMAALAVTSARIGLVCTQSTSFTHPYTIARQFASLDLLSGGRAAWNIVTSTQQAEALNHGEPTLTGHADRYERAAEFVQVVRGLWETTDKELILGDKETGRLFDAEKIRVFKHEGQHYSAEGILNVPPSPQGRPMIVQAGASGPGRDLAANEADLIFCTTPMLDVALDYYRDMQDRITAAGRDPGAVAITPGLLPVIGRTEEEAQEKLAHLDTLIHSDLSRAMLADLLGNFDLSPYPLDAPFSSLANVGSKSKTLVEMIGRLAGQSDMTIGQIAARLCAAHTHARAVGTPEQVADMMEHWFTSRACDGFLIFPLVAGEITQFVDLVVPILQRRGLFHEDYEGATFRENMR